MKKVYLVIFAALLLFFGCQNAVDSGSSPAAPSATTGSILVDDTVTDATTVTVSGESDSGDSFQYTFILASETPKVTGLDPDGWTVYVSYAGASGFLAIGSDTVTVTAGNTATVSCVESLPGQPGSTAFEAVLDEWLDPIFDAYGVPEDVRTYEADGVTFDPDHSFLLRQAVVELMNIILGYDLSSEVFQELLDELGASDETALTFIDLILGDDNYEYGLLYYLNIMISDLIDGGFIVDVDEAPSILDWIAVYNECYDTFQANMYYYFATVVPDIVDVTISGLADDDVLEDDKGVSASPVMSDAECVYDWDLNGADYGTGVSLTVLKDDCVTGTNKLEAVLSYRDVVLGDEAVVFEVEEASGRLLIVDIPFSETNQNLKNAVTATNKTYADEVTYLYIADKDLSDGGLTGIDYLVNLNTLVLVNTNLAKVDDVDYIFGLTNLTTLGIISNPMSTGTDQDSIDAREALEAALSGCSITYN